MRIRCDYCCAEADFNSTVDALAAGWYTHRVTTASVGMFELEVVPVVLPGSISMGFICALCVPDDDGRNDG